MADARLPASLVRMRQRRTGPLILELDLTDGITEGPPADPLSALLTMRRTRLQDLLDGLRRAAGDDRVRLQRRLVAIGDALKVPGADAARGAWRLDRLLADIAQAPGAPPDRTF